MTKGVFRRRAIKIAALLLATMLTAMLTTILARYATDMIITMDTGSVSQTLARNLTASEADTKLIAAGKDPGPEFKKTIERAVSGKTIAGYRLFSPNGDLKLEISRLSAERQAFGKAVEAAVRTQTLVTRSGWTTAGSDSLYVSYAFVPVQLGGKTVAVQAILLDQTERWNNYFHRILLLMWIACCIAIASVSIPVLFWYRQNRTLLYHEAEMHNMLMRFKAVFDNMPQGVTLFDRDSKLVIANDQYVKFYQLRSDAVKSGTSLEALREHRLARGAPENILDIYEKPDPEKLTGEHRAKRWHLDDGRILETQRYSVPGGGWVTMHTDITQRVARENDLHRTQNFLNSVIEHMPGAVIVKKPETLEYVLINKKAEEILGLPARKVIGKTASELFDGNQSTDIDRRDLEVLRQKNSSAISDEQIVQTPGNGERRIATKRIVLRNQANEPQSLITMIDDVTEQRKAEQKVRYLAMHDALTGLYNRAYFNEEIERHIERTRDGGDLALMLIDLDGFKEVNDTFGHPAGDEVLRVTAQRLRSIFCDIDLIARLGGDEFAVLCRSTNCQLDLQVLASRMIKEIQSVIAFDDREIKVGATVGIAVLDSGSVDAPTLLRHADVAMYEAKESGKSNFCFFDLGMMLKRLHRKQLEADMVFAIERNQFELVYQPIVSPRTNSVRSFEALLRWRHHERGMISPVEFIPVAEETGLIVPIGEYVLEKACAAAKLWPDDIRISVNLSPVQFRDRKLAAKVLEILQRSGIDPKRLELEITEAALLQENEDNMTILEELRNTGVRIVMDDFGTGYSSLNYLRSFPFDKIKIDRSYIKDLVSKNGNSLTIVHAVLALAAGLSLATTAEGVETKEQLDILNAAGCDEIQGFYFSKPLPPADIPALIQRICQLSLKAA